MQRVEKESGCSHPLRSRTKEGGGPAKSNRSEPSCQTRRRGYTPRSSVLPGQKAAPRKGRVQPVVHEGPPEAKRPLPCGGGRRQIRLQDPVLESAPEAHAQREVEVVVLQIINRIGRPMHTGTDRRAVIELIGNNRADPIVGEAVRTLWLNVAVGGRQIERGPRALKRDAVADRSLEGPRFKIDIIIDVEGGRPTIRGPSSGRHRPQRYHRGPYPGSNNRSHPRRDPGCR